jgi:glucose/arabinose dehydrogenase
MWQRCNGFRVAAIAFLTLSSATSASAQLRTRLIVSGLTQPAAFIQDPTDSAVQFIVQRTGSIRVLVNGSLQAEPFLDLTDQVRTEVERGLVGLAFPPDAATSRRFFVQFVNRDGNAVLARYKRQANNPLQADPATRFDLMWPSGLRYFQQPSEYHISGTLRFGPDGYLYISKGDGGGNNDPANNGQNPHSLFGKILRIDVNVPDDDTRGYRVPQDNPFVDGVPVSGLGEIWALGFRNPWKFSFDDPNRGGTGGIFVGDVGEKLREEVDFIPAGKGGRNYGWRIREGSLPGEAPPTSPSVEPLIPPLYDYDRAFGRTVIGGYVYRGRLLPARYQGRYFFGDFITRRLVSLGLAYHPDGEASVVDLIDHTDEVGEVGMIVAIDVDSRGELYLVDFRGAIRRLEGPPTLTLDIVGGSGEVTLSPPGMECTESCSQTYARTTTVTLTPRAAAGFRFSGWGGDPDCLDGTVRVDSAVSCVATFMRVRDRKAQEPHLRR